MSTLFTPVDWASTGNIYEVNTRQYTKEGTFNAFRTHLPRLRDMGVDILWFMPITPISKAQRQGSLGSYYACSSYTEINPEFGTKEDFNQLVKDAQAQGFKVIIDWVANHTGWDHHWTKEHPEWYMRDTQGSFTEKNGWKDVIDLDYSDAAMQQEMINCMLYWVKEFNIDGFRCDMAHLMPLDFWKKARTQSEQGKKLFWLGECELPEYNQVFDVTYAWQWMHETENVAKGTATLNNVRNVLHSYSQYPAGILKMLFTSNHDENSWNGTEYEKYGDAAKAWAVFTCTWKGMPLIYSGQEEPNTKRLKFFDKDEIVHNTPPVLHSFYKALLQLHGSKAVASGDTFILPAPQENVMAFLRFKEEQVVLVLLNISNQERVKVAVDSALLKGDFKNIFSGLKYQFNVKEVFELEPYDYLVYTK
ncbi:alpha-amylase family glycosyl hydrolase [Chitinophagaceae bacterium LWZ2-11]